MAASVFLILSWMAAHVLVQRLAGSLAPLARLAGAAVVGILLTAWTTFAAAWTAHGFGHQDATRLGCWVATGMNLVIVVAGRDALRRDTVRLSRAEQVGAAVAAAVAAWTMHARLSGDPLTVSLNTWGDTGLHIGLARSFSEGSNFPPELPLFAGEPIRYHFGFDFYAGALDRLGVPIGLAFNIPGALAYAAILLLLVELARQLWRSPWTGVIAAVLFATNGSMAFLRYLEASGGLAAALDPGRVWNHVGYDAGGPYNGDEIAIFWTPNAYLTQTHLLVAVALVLFLTLCLLPAVRPAQDGSLDALPPTRALALGGLLGATFWINGIVVVAAGVFCLALFAVYRAPWRSSAPFLAAVGALALPQLVWLNGGLGAGGSAGFHLGYLVSDFHLTSPGSWLDFTRYWWLNVGLVFPLLVLLALRGDRADRRLLAAVTAIFLLGNVIAFGRELGGHNHKVFNLWEVLVNLLAAHALVCLLRALWHGRFVRGSRPVGRIGAVAAGAVASVLLLASGILDLMTLKNDPRYDVLGNRAAAVDWIRSSTPRDALFLTAYGETYTTPTLAGRPVYLGGFGPWTAIMGYDNVPRERRVASIYTAPSREAACERLDGLDVDYLQFGFPERQTAAFRAQESAFQNFTVAYTDGVFTFFDVRSSCGFPPRRPVRSGAAEDPAA